MQEEQKTKQISFQLPDLSFVFFFLLLFSTLGFLLTAANIWIAFVSNKDVEKWRKIMVYLDEKSECAMRILHSFLFIQLKLGYFRLTLKF